MWSHYYAITMLLFISAQAYTLKDLPMTGPSQTGGYGKEEKAEETKEERDELLQKFFSEWMLHMKDFDPSNMLNLLIAAGEKLAFVERIDQVPQTLRGAYSVSAKLRNKIVFTVYDPAGIPILIKDREREAIFHAQLNVTGEYVLEFSNQNVWMDWG